MKPHSKEKLDEYFMNTHNKINESIDAINELISLNEETINKQHAQKLKIRFKKSRETIFEAYHELSKATFRNTNTLRQMGTSQFYQLSSLMNSNGVTSNENGTETTVSTEKPIIFGISFSLIDVWKTKKENMRVDDLLKKVENDIRTINNITEIDKLNKISKEIESLNEKTTKELSKKNEFTLKFNYSIDYTNINDYIGCTYVYRRIIEKSTQEISKNCGELTKLIRKIKRLDESEVKDFTAEFMKMHKLILLKISILMTIYNQTSYALYTTSSASGSLGTAALKKLTEGNE